ncbi:hypothetical protein FDH01_gp143 [Acinetobacter phage vB_AbaM_ME3]|uniref:Uncharacterized protein n=1 Tax=Acinetobacter phage vB_AbaM_ME3 TaxID=1837876 RepID=A0A172Q119_9CAUD|nr:hypothetical protein FDH01_gp143 [Acinetobacter phage vB_AbaM_ME3]AND75479.1 hypothetical protein ME3_318 [Acinetobacter phage vB_AbaM_ME3]
MSQKKIKDELQIELTRLLQLPHEESKLPLQLLIIKVCIEEDYDSLQMIKDSIPSLFAFIVDETVTLLENIERRFKL